MISVSIEKKVEECYALFVIRYGIRKVKTKQRTKCEMEKGKRERKCRSVGGGVVLGVGWRWNGD